MMAPPLATDWGKGILEDGREDILEWREKRLKQAEAGTLLRLKEYTFNISTLRTFIRNFNCMVVFNMVLGGVAVYLAQRFQIDFDIQLSLLISPIVFPLAFSINTDFQRRDMVLEFIAHFESAAMVLYMCMREWRKDTGFDLEWINNVHAKLRSVLFLLREYLFTGEDENRSRILRATYEDFSDISLIIEELRTSKLQSNGPLLSRVIHQLNVMCTSFERLRVVKEYRSPRSIRAFNKVLITFLPLFMAPYFVYLGNRGKNQWSPYLISVVVSFVFSALQGVQDKLDDPFDGMGEDDIKLNAIEDWTLNSFEATVQRLKTGRFNINLNMPENKKSHEFTDNTLHVNSFDNEAFEVYSPTHTATSSISGSKRSSPIGFHVPNPNSWSPYVSSNHGNRMQSERKSDSFTDRVSTDYENLRDRINSISKKSKQQERRISAYSKLPGIKRKHIELVHKRSKKKGEQRRDTNQTIKGLGDLVISNYIAIQKQGASTSDTQSNANLDEKSSLFGFTNPTTTYASVQSDVHQMEHEDERSCGKGLKKQKQEKVDPNVLPPIRRQGNGLTTVFANTNSLSHDKVINGINVTENQRNPQKTDSLNESKKHADVNIDCKYEPNDSAMSQFLQEKYKVFSIEQLISPDKRLCIVDYQKNQILP